MRSFKNDEALIPFWINCWLQSTLTPKQGWRLTDDGWAPVPTENRGSGGAVLCDIPKAVSSLSHHCTVDGWRISVELLNSCSHREQTVPTENMGSERSRLVWHMRQWALYHSTAWGGGVWSKKWAFYHYIARLGDGTADADGWLKMTIQWWWFQTHCSEKQNTSQKGQSLPFPLVAGRTNRFFYMVQQPWFLVFRTNLSMLCTTTYLTRWKERGTIRSIYKNYRQGYILTNLINMSVKLFSTVSIVFFPVDFKSARYHSRFCIFH